MQDTQQKTGSKWQETDKIFGTLVAVPSASSCEAHSSSIQFNPGRSILWFEVSPAMKVAVAPQKCCMAHEGSDCPSLPTEEGQKTGLPFRWWP